jgi:glycogen operon protein
MAFRVNDGSPAPLGVTLDEDGANVAVFSTHATAIDLCLFDAAGAVETARVRLPARTDDIFHGHVGGIRPGQRYGLRAHGPYEPEAGHRFNANKLLLDPYACVIDRPFALHPTMFGYVQGDARADLSFDARDSAPFMPKAIVAPPAVAAGPASPAAPWADTIVYELHARGFTKSHPEIPLPLRGTVAALSHPAAIAHLSGLGVTAIEIMPLAAWIDERHLRAAGLANYWGYNPIALMAPDPRLAPGGWDEIRDAVAALHAANIEVILDVVFNHTGEGDALGPTVSLRGLDNAAYYRLMPDDGRAYANDAGCGNVLALDRPHVVALVIEALMRWTARANVDGFRFDLATTLGRGDHGFDPGAPLIDAITRHPLLGRCKLIAEPWDIGPRGHRLGAFPPTWSEWNDRFRDTARRFWRGEAGLVGDMATRFAGSSDIFAGGRPSRGVNFVTAHDGFTLADLVSFNDKHNQANGENNRDGTDANYSWNSGAEGPTDDAGINARRRRDQRNLLATLVLARGTPMIAMGAELGHSQGGNNNAYAQDNATAWLDWTRADRSLFAFCRRLIALRKTHRALRDDVFLAGRVAEGAAWPDVEWRAPDGRIMTASDWEDGGRRTLVATFYCPDSAREDADRVTIILHAGAEPISVTLPPVGAGRSWREILDTSRDDGEPAALFPPRESEIVCANSCVRLFAEVDDPHARGARREMSTELLDQLARAVGIAPGWFDIAGARHVVPDETKQAILRGFGFAIATKSQLRDSLARLSEEDERRPLPWTHVAREEEPIRVGIVVASERETADFIIRREEGAESRVSLRLSDPRSRSGIDGRPLRHAEVMLPPLPIGRHALIPQDGTEMACALTVAPASCHLPQTFAAGARMFGIAAQLYSLRGDRDQGIGDFSVLGDLAEHAGALRAATVGLNPLHALFARDRARASPYHPSDRRFLDPIYIDLTALDAIAEGLRPDGALSQYAGPIAALRELSDVDYVGVWKVKQRALEESHAAFRRMRARRPDAPASRDFATFAADGGAALHRFAAFELISELFDGRPPREWPAELASGRADEIDALARTHSERHDFHIFLQWLCDRQLADAAARGTRHGLPLRFYRDLAVGAAPDGAEMWMQADQFLRDLSIGAPPDPFAEGGQVWNLPPPNPIAWRRSGYAAFRALIAANMRHAGALRVDHVMGLTRLFVVPNGATTSEGAYLSYPLGDLLGELALESVRARCLVVGEALGTVPEGFRETIASNGVLSYRVLWFEREGNAFIPPAAYDRNAVACVSTHDLPTLTGWWRGEDIAEREHLGHFSAEEARAARAVRADDRRAVLSALRAEDLIAEDVDADAPLPEAVMVAIHRFIGRSASALVMAQIDDLAGLPTSVNLPGTDRERSNWRRRLPVPASEILKGNARDALAALAEQRRPRS